MMMFGCIMPDIMGKRLIAVCLALPFCLPSPLASGNTNGTNGSVALWECHHNFSGPSEANRIYWQGQVPPYNVLHLYRKGKEDLQHQDKLFRNRTYIFPHQIQSGNLSLGIKLDLTHDKKKVEVVIYDDNNPIKICQTTLYVAVSFQAPKVTLNKTDMTATCSTNGGYPKPDIKWTSSESGHERTLEDNEIQIDITEENGLYNIISKANATGAENMTCSVYNPTLQKTLNGSFPAEEKTNPNGNWVRGAIIAAVVVVVVGVVAAVVVAAVVLHRRNYYRRPDGQQRNQQNHEDEIL